jgi:hypothetical protein
MKSRHRSPINLSSAVWGAAEALILKQELPEERTAMTQELMASYVKTNGTLDKGMVDFAFGLLAPAKTAAHNDLFDLKTPAGLKIYLAALDSPEQLPMQRRFPRICFNSLPGLKLLRLMIRE